MREEKSTALFNILIAGIQINSRCEEGHGVVLQVRFYVLSRADRRSTETTFVLVLKPFVKHRWFRNSEANIVFSLGTNLNECNHDHI